MAAATLTSKGQVTIPKKIRVFLHLKPGDKLEFIPQNDGQVIVKPTTIDVSELEGILYRANRKPVSIEKMNEDIRKRAGSAS